MGSRNGDLLASNTASGHLRLERSHTLRLLTRFVEHVSLERGATVYRIQASSTGLGYALLNEGANAKGA